MPKRIVPLSDKQIKNAKPGDKDFCLYDGFGLFLLVTTTGGKLWRFKYAFEGKSVQMAWGTYPELTLVEVREKRSEARRQLALGMDPRAELRAKRESDSQVENCFEVVAREWHTKFKHTWKECHAKTIKDRLEKDVYPWLGSLPIAAIKPTEILAILRKIEERGAPDQAHRVRFMVGQVMRYAVATGRAERDASADLKGALSPPHRGHFAAPTDPKQVAPMLRAIDGYTGTLLVRCALKLAPMLFVRPGELRHAEWAEFDLDAAQWDIPAEKMKMKLPHLVPLPSQAVELLKELKPLTGGGRYLFPSIRSITRPMSENTITSALRYLGFEKEVITGHGFRAMARTILDEVLHVRPDFIEHQLAHAVRDPNGRAYNRTAHLEARRAMMQQWADYLDELRTKFTSVTP